MKVTSCLLVAVLALLSSPVLARKSYLIKLDHKDRIPKLKASVAELVLYKDFDDDITLKYSGGADVGWEWTQTMTENQDALPDVYHLTLDIVFKQSAYFSPVLNMPRLIYLEPEVEVSEFTVGYKLDLAKFWEYTSGERKDEICISSMFAISEMTITSNLVMRF